MVVIAAVDQTNATTSVILEARELAEAFDDELHVVHVLSQSRFADLEQEKVRQTGQPGGRSAGNEYASEIAAELGEIAGLDESEFEPIGLVGDPSQQIVDYATENDARYITIGGRKRSPIGKVVFGSTSQSVLMKTDHPVVTVKRES
jgi:nucleotide-binding universal stress UspA family protein